MTLTKRLLDILLALVLGIILLPVAAAIAAILLLRDGRPIFYISERMKTFEEGFNLVKFRTMTGVAKDSGVSGGDKAARITPTGHFLRRTRLDEIPQIWNVLKGDISFVGPRPPLRQYVERFPQIYREVLRSRPGITGLASIYFHAHEERLLARSSSTEETDEIYCQVCVPRKARLDLIYQKRRNLCFDMVLMLKTVFKGLR
ncbi:sugar transferase [Paracoccus saliphilus]|uniref:Sugar transferase n=1 Tax=Paracoccus saliphilus TaxID=405559 RepID=A0AA45W7A2_9RHOB|nr:sugar transferase [Paracoccus saliphilus]WCR03122.1 sugar transferase [Paracoccus saliphilus]SIT07996.1 Sugar transferase involved in LPS biosynthesis (colanic, teichoic acid) [Paracoccus saliphilus]